MLRSKRSRAAVGLCIVVLGAMMISAIVAQAENGAIWRVKGVSIGTTLLPLVQVKEIEKLPITGTRHLTLLGMIGKSKVEILCGELVLVNFLLHQEGKSLGKLLYKQCKTFLNGVESPVCEPDDGTAGHITAEVKDLLVLHEYKPGATETVDKFEPLVAGEPFATVEFSEECLLGPEIPITGVFYLKDCTRSWIRNV